ncbi:hypothetical protein DL98DRAFT_518314 [Cadophora sp. DSE1049]|nr:hypothetical protein DL98DRAFT_518314 [Cadophora sp. DSE1049]
MDHNYLLNPGIQLLADQIEPGSTEAEVQKMWDNILHTAFPAEGYWMIASRHRTGAIEPDNVVSKLVNFTGGWATLDVLVVELKRSKEGLSRRDFDDNVNNYLDDFMAESTNPSGSILYGAVGIGHHIMFYRRVLPRGAITSLHHNPLHVINDAYAVQQQFNHIKENVPRGHYAPAAAEPVAVAPAAVSPAAVAPAAVAPAAEYYYRVGKKYYHTSSNRSLKDCPLEVWVRDALGWNTGGGKKWRWRYADGSHDYRDDEE